MDLEHIHTYIRQYHPSAASAIVQRIRDSIKKLSDFPYSGRQGKVFSTRELIITNTRYNAVFRIMPDRVEILKIIHQAQNWEEAIPDT